MVGHHIPQRADCVIKAAPVPNAEHFLDRDLHMIDVVSVLDRLEHPVSKAQHQDVLYGLLTEIMVDTVDLVLVEDAQELKVQRPSRG